MTPPSRLSLRSCRVARSLAFLASVLLAASCDGGDPAGSAGPEVEASAPQQSAPAVLPPPSMPDEPIPGPPYTFDGVGTVYAEFAERGFSDPPPADPTALDAWRTATRHALLGALASTYQPPEALDLGVYVLGSEHFDGYRRDEVSYFVEPRLRVRAFLYGPDAPGPHAAVLHWHGHAEGGHLAPAGVEPYATYTENDAARRLAEAGFVVLAPTVRSLHAGRIPHAVFTGVTAALADRQPASYYLADALRAMDVLSAVDGVDAQRIGVSGVSLGGFIALVQGALDERVAAVTVSGFYPSYHGSLTRTFNCACTFSSEIASRLDIPHLGVLVSPRPLQVVAGERDGEFSYDEARANFATTAGFYERQGAGDAAVFAGHGEGHLWHDESVIPWLSAVLAAE